MGHPCYEQHFSDLHTAVDNLQAHFQEQIEAPGVNGEASPLCRLKLAVHEWMANLMRHAHFGERTPEVHVRVWKEDACFYCSIEDNSLGFDFEAHLAQHDDGPAALAREMPENGMGLSLLIASTEHATYDSLGEDRNRLELAVPVARSRLSNTQ